MTTFLSRPQKIRYAALVELVEVESPRAGDLRQQRRRPHDRAGDQVREERDERRELDEVPRRLDLAAIDVDDVAHRLERVERDADRQHDLEVPERDRQPRPAQGLMQALGEEVVVLEDSRACPGSGPCSARRRPCACRGSSIRVDPEPAGVVHHRGEDQEREEPGVPPGVEVIGRSQQQDVLRRGAIGPAASRRGRARRRRSRTRTN